MYLMNGGPRLVSELLVCGDYSFQTTITETLCR
jgi:hypothetical protein